VDMSKLSLAGGGAKRTFELADYLYVNQT
jgi:hypothetical protein